MTNNTFTQYQLIFDWARNFVREQSEGEWDDVMIDKDAARMAAQIIYRLPGWQALTGI